MPVDLMAHRLVWCREPATQQDRDAAALRPGRPQARALPVALAPFGAPLDPAGLAALAEAAGAAVGRGYARLFGRRSSGRVG